MLEDILGAQEHIWRLVVVGDNLADVWVLLHNTVVAYFYQWDQIICVFFFFKYSGIRGSPRKSAIATKWDGPDTAARLVCFIF